MSDVDYYAEEMADYTEDPDLDPSIPPPLQSPTPTLPPSQPSSTTTTTTADDDDDDEDPEIVEMKRRLAELEEENTKIAALSSSSSSPPTGAPPSYAPSSTSSTESDSRSVYVGNVDYSSTKEELTSLFSSCGPVLRVTLPTTSTGHPKGFAYVEFADRESISTATLLNDTEFKGRQLKVIPKRTNLPAFQLGRGGGRGGGEGGGEGGG